MIEFRELSMAVEEARRLAKADAPAAVDHPDWCLAQLTENSDLRWRNLAPSLRACAAIYPDLVPRVHALAAPPRAMFGIALPASQAQKTLRLRAALALLWLGEDAGLDSVVQALEGSDGVLRALALEGIAEYRADLRWPDLYYEVLFDSCQKIFDGTKGDERMHIVSAMFERPVPALADAMRALLATVHDFRRGRAAMWLLQHGHEEEVRGYVSHIVQAPFPATRQQRSDWYEYAMALIAHMKAYYSATPAPASRAWATATVLALTDRLVSAAQVEGEPAIEERWYGLSGALHAMAADLGPDCAPLLLRWANSHAPSGLYRGQAMVMYSSMAGAAAVDVVLAELAGAAFPAQGDIARQLMTVAPPSRYAALAPVVRALFDAVAPLHADDDDYYEHQEGLAGLAAALAQCDPQAAPRIAARLPELQPIQAREVGYALAGRTPARIAALLAVGGAITPMARTASQRFYSDGNLVRNLIERQGRLAKFNSRDDDNRSTAEQVVHRLARITIPPLILEALAPTGDGGIRLVHAERVYALDGGGDEEYVGAAAAFNLFLAHVGHPQRVFQIGDDGGDTDNDIAAFVCGDPARLPAAAAQLGFPIMQLG